MNICISWVSCYITKVVKMGRDAKVLYVALDVEAAGPKLGAHSILSIGCGAVVREDMSFNEYQAQGLTFYAEVRPLFRGFPVGPVPLKSKSGAVKGPALARANCASVCPASPVRE